MKKTILQKQEKGFTIIEVLIVLAIAGLIVLVVFLAVPALQRNSRNTQRKNDASAVAGAIQEAINNRNGQRPANAAAITDNVKLSFYQASDVNYPTTAPTSAVTSIASPDTNLVYVRDFAKCNAAGDGLEATAANVTKRNIAVIYHVEMSNGAPLLQCQTV